MYQLRNYGIAWLAFNRPEVLNALNPADIHRFKSCFFTTTYFDW
jgi:enoyl-CoA hydratase/carnithine racemase